MEDNLYNVRSISQGKKLASGYRSSWAKRLQDDEDERKKQQLLKAQQEQKAQDDKPWWQKAVDFGADTGKNIVAGLEQGAGHVADAAIKGGALLDELGNEIQGGTEEEKNKRREANIANSEKLRGAVKSIKDINGNNLEGTKDIGLNDIEKDPKKLAELAGEGLKVGLDATALVNPTRSVVEGAAGAGAREGFKQAAKDSLFYGGTGGAAEGLSTFGETGDVGKAVEQGAKTAALTAATQGALEVGGTVAGQVLGKGKRAQAAEQATLDAKNQADEAAKALADEADAAELLKRPFRDATDEQLSKEVSDFQSGVRSDNVEADYNRYQAVRDELSKREREAYKANGGQTVEQARSALEAFDKGENLPEAVYKDAAPVTSAEDVLSRPYTPEPVKQVAKAIQNQKAELDKQMEGLMTPQVKQEAVSRLDEQYDMKLKDLQRRFSSLEQPTRAKDGTVDQTINGQRLSGEYKQDVRYTVAKDKLDQEYKDQISELDMLEAKDADEVASFKDKADQLAFAEQNLVMDSNKMFRDNPNNFRDIDPAERDAQREVLAKNLADAERFDDPQNVVTEVATAPDPVKSFDNNPDAPDAFSTQVSEQVDAMTDTVRANFKNVDGLKLSALRLMSPSQVLEKMGLRGKELDLHSNILKAESALNLANKADSEVLQKIAAILPNNKDAQRQIVEYLEGNRKTLSAIGDTQVADEIRSFLDTKRAGLEAQGFKTLDDYFPHIFDKKDPEVQRLFKGKVTGEISFSNLKQRLTDSDNYSRDVMDVLATYASGYNRKTILEPALKPLADLKTQVTLQNAEAKWIDGYVEQLMGFDKSHVGESFNTFMDGVYKNIGMESLVGKNHYNEALGTQRMISAAATMGLNPGTAIRNMTQMVNTVADIGPRYSTIGAVDGIRALRAGPGSAEWAELQRAGIMEGGVSQNYFDAITSAGIKGRVSKTRDAATKGLMSLIRATDVSLRAQAYYGAKALGRSKGLTDEALENFAIRHTVDTQFITSRVDMPLAFNGQGVRSLAQLATFSGKQAGFLKRAGVKMVKGADGKGFRMADAGNVLAGVVTAWAATAALNNVIGMRETEWIPFYDQIAPFFGAKGDSLYRSPIVTLLTGDGKGKVGLIEALQTGDLGSFFQDNWSQIIPAGTQIKKTTEGLQTTDTGLSTNSSGNIRFQQNQDFENKVKAGLFGQYVTPNGQAWIDQGFPTLTDKQTQTVKEQPTQKEKSQYIDFYQAGKMAGGRQKAYDSVKDAITNGDVNKASRLADEYNQKLTDAMKQYWAKHDDMPQDLQDIMFSRMYIDVNRVDDNVKENS